jgi:hypothetical protein
MKLESWLQVGRDYTSRASTIARTLALSGFGIIWLIITENEDISIKEPLLFSSLLLLAIGILLDFLQYFLGGLFWIQFYYQKSNSGITGDTEIEGDYWRTNTLYIIYALKFIVLLIAYILVIISIFKYIG